LEIAEEMVESHKKDMGKKQKRIEERLSRLLE
jgi:predicted nuclease of restriction endonuclease-like RecB superfamily